MKIAKPIIKIANKYYRDGMAPEVKISKIPDHIIPWMYDLDNPFQKKVVPLHTLV